MTEELNRRLEFLERENAVLRATIEAWKEHASGIDTGYVIVDETPPIVCYGVHDTINEAWEDFLYGGQVSGGTRSDYESRGCRAVRVAVVRVEK